MFTSLPSTTLFLLTSGSGTLLALSSHDWLSVWLGLELNLLSFVPLLSLSKTQQETEASVKYFLPQALGSTSLLLTNITMMTFHSNFITLYFLLFPLSLFLKAGLAPLHFWFPNVMASLNWPNCLLLSTWQKLLPLSLIFFTMNSTPSIIPYISVTLSAMVGGLMGLNQTLLRPLLAYSSINHMAWMTAAALVSPPAAMFYFFIYVVTTGSLMTMLHLSKLTSPMHLYSLISTSPVHKTMIATTLLSLAGLPPLLGFLPKWLVLELLLPHTLLLPTTLILSSLLTLFYYLMVIFSLSLSHTITHYLNLSSPTHPFAAMVTCLLLNLTPFILLMICALILFN